MAEIVPFPHHLSTPSRASRQPERDFLFIAEISFSGGELGFSIGYPRRRIPLAIVVEMLRRSATLLENSPPKKV